MSKDIFSSTFTDVIDHEGQWELNVNIGKECIQGGNSLNSQSYDISSTSTLGTIEQEPPEDIPLHVDGLNMNGFQIVDMAANTYSSNYKVGLQYLPTQREEMARVKGGKFNIMVAGRQGSGKTTFLNSLFKTNLQLHTSPKQTFNICLKKYNFVEESVNLEVTCIDTPGFGDSLDNRYCWMHLVNFIDNQFESYLHQMEQPHRMKANDIRVHCCIYFLSNATLNSPLSPLDIESMKELSKRVNLLPVISKADLYTEDELNLLKQKVRESIIKEEISVCEFVEDHLVKKCILSMTPHAIIGANHEKKLPDGDSILLRKYPWGQIEIENKSHCDFAALRDVLISQNMLELIQSTEANYYLFRASYLTKRFERAVSLLTKFLKKHSDNGLVQFVVYNQSKPTAIGETVEETDLFKAQQLELQRKFNSDIQLQESRFKDWKRQLTERQSVLNSDLENCHFQLMKLQQQVKRMEEENELAYNTPVSKGAGLILAGFSERPPSSRSPQLSVSSEDDYYDNEMS
ncbi:uncharacterized protein KQ657_003212 [Scheffersomyces spartinae]|uniref:Septin-type G domain-containing protein n=1 Tax=Scheffersomyces spartinae TaxID=45513 RepID=A0A9P8AJH3_9ASCO|nr:uncharacterized protein KQ657_003212 [Scheffersomyces spartinae]KAG7195450.1 hypothetical protein KQ657_003212 [Scheffersomyces spartinae]